MLNILRYTCPLRPSLLYEVDISRIQAREYETESKIVIQRMCGVLF